MFWRINEHRALLPALCGLVFLALWNNAVVWTFCPHLNARPHHCFSEELSDMSADSATMGHKHHHEMAMNEQAMPLEYATRDYSAGGDIKPSTEQLLSIVITESPESCSHCMMHSPSAVNSPSILIVVNNSGSHGMVPAASMTLLASVASRLDFVDVHDHGPPGLSSSRYILNSSFRI